MRKILFRAKSKHDKNFWIYGGIIHQTDHYGEKVDRWFVVDGTDTYDYDIGEPYEVDKSTIGQYTGLTDKNGVKIFEGDIIQRKGYIYPLGKQEPCGERIVRGSVIWMDDGRNAGCWCIDSKDEHGNPTTYSFDNSFIVSGNIHDNPELLK